MRLRAAIFSRGAIRATTALEISTDRAIRATTAMESSTDRAIRATTAMESSTDIVELSQNNAFCVYNLKTEDV